MKSSDAKVFLVAAHRDAIAGNCFIVAQICRGESRGVYLLGYRYFVSSFPRLSISHPRPRRRRRAGGAQNSPSTSDYPSLLSTLPFSLSLSSFPWSRTEAKLLPMLARTAPSTIDAHAADAYILRIAMHTIQRDANSVRT